MVSVYTPPPVEGGVAESVAFAIDPREDLIAIFMGQLHPTGGLNLDPKVIHLAYQAIKD